MRRVDAAVDQSPSFIGGWYLDELNLCSDLIKFFDDHKERQRQGVTLHGLKPELKNSIDLTIAPNELNDPAKRCIKKYIGKLYDCYSDYLEQWPFLKKTFPELDIGRFNIQKYNDGGHFAHIHSERTDLASLHRLFAFMTYLNDEFEGGETSFIHQNIKIKPEAGKTLIWPAEWTHAHAGEVVRSGSKYIVTGWMLLPH
jgi:prolyl 4-hydroxylase